jgi:Nucleotidyl transferase AbiEii toxin, Type IV TA system
MPPKVVLETLQVVWTALQALHVPMALVGGLAMSAWKRPRFTKDVDLLLAIHEPDAKVAIGPLLAKGFRSKGPEAMVRLADGSRFIQLIYDMPDALLDIQVDLILATSEFHRQAIARRVTLPRAELGFEIDIVSCEDLIVLKLVAGRILDRVDAGELLKANRNSLDFGYLMGWVRKLKLQRAFGEAWTDAFPNLAPPA